MSVGATLAASFLVTLGRPATWPLALAAFLVRGGLFLVIAPILVLPSAVGVANVTAPMLTSIVFGGVSPEVVAVVVVAGLAGVAWRVGGGLFAATLEVEQARLVASDGDVVGLLGAGSDGAPPPRSEAGTLATAWRILAVRLVAEIPLLIALMWGLARIVAVAYRELTLPSDVVTPVVIRVVRGVPEAVVAIIVTWLIGQVVGTAGSRHVVLGGQGVPAALAGAIRRALRHPGRALALELVPFTLLVAVLVPAALAAATGWAAVRASLGAGGSTTSAVVAVAAFVGLWLGGLVLTGAVSAWRAAAWTLEVAGTFGPRDAAERGTGAAGTTLAR